MPQFQDRQYQQSDLPAVHLGGRPRASDTYENRFDSKSACTNADGKFQAPPPTWRAGWNCGELAACSHLLSASRYHGNRRFENFHVIFILTLPLIESSVIQVEIHVHSRGQLTQRPHQGGPTCKALTAYSILSNNIGCSSLFIPSK